MVQPFQSSLPFRAGSSIEKKSLNGRRSQTPRVNTIIFGRKGTLPIETIFPDQFIRSLAPYFGTAIFLLTYLLIALGENSPRKLDRPTAGCWGCAHGDFLHSHRKEATEALNVSTLSVLFGMLVLLVALMHSGLPARIGKSLSRCRSPRMLMAAIVFVSGTASAAMLNDTVCLRGTPFILEITMQAEISPVPFLFALATVKT